MNIILHLINIVQQQSEQTFRSGCRQSRPPLPMPCPQTKPLYFLHIRNRTSTSETGLSFPPPSPSSFRLCESFYPLFFSSQKNLISETATIFSSTSETGIHIRNMPDFSIVEATLKSPNAFCLLTFFRVSFVERREN